MNMTASNLCGCVRSLTGKCAGWYALTEEKYLERTKFFLAKQAVKSERSNAEVIEVCNADIILIEKDFLG